MERHGLPHPPRGSTLSPPAAQRSAAAVAAVPADVATAASTIADLSHAKARDAARAVYDAMLDDDVAGTTPNISLGTSDSSADVKVAAAVAAVAHSESKVAAARQLIAASAAEHRRLARDTPAEIATTKNLAEAVATAEDQSRISSPVAEGLPPSRLRTSPEPEPEPEPEPTGPLLAATNWKRRASIDATGPVQPPSPSLSSASSFQSLEEFEDVLGAFDEYGYMRKSQEPSRANTSNGFSPSVAQATAADDSRVQSDSPAAVSRQMGLGSVGNLGMDGALIKPGMIAEGGSSVASMVQLLLEGEASIRDEVMEEKVELRRQMEASLEAHRVALREEAKLEIEARVREVEERLTPRDAITSLQCEKLQTRLAKMHSAELFTTMELHTFEDLLADYVELKLSVGVLTSETVHAFDAPRQVLLLVGLSESIVADDAFARQARRKFL